MEIMKIVWAFIAAFGFAIILNVPKKYMIYTSMAGGIGWIVYLLIYNNGISRVLSVFWAAFTVAVMAHIFARIIKAPVTIFLIPGIFTLVPGEGMYKIVYNMIQGENALMAHYFNLTIQTAGMIALGIFIADSLFRIKKDFFRKKRG